MNENTTIRLWRQGVPIDMIAMRLRKPLDEVYFIILTWIDQNPPPNYPTEWRR